MPVEQDYPAEETTAPGLLPAEPADRLTKPLMRFLRIEAAAGVVLLLSAVTALALANSTQAAAFLAFWDVTAGAQFAGVEFSRSLKHWINDGLMTLFFFVVALELKREMVLGELRSPQAAALSLAGALGGMAVPAGLYLSLYLLMDSGGPAIHGWGAVMTTDTAFVIGCLAILGARIPPSLRIFLLSLAIFDDIGATMVIAIGYGQNLNWTALGLSGVGLAMVVATARLGVRNLPIYFALGGLIWLAMDASGIHPTLVGVILGLMTPAHGWVSDDRLRAILDRVIAYPPGAHWSGDTVDRQDLRRAGVATRETLSPVEQLEILLHPWVAFLIMPLFALANAGLPIVPDMVDSVVVIMMAVSFIVGKPAGVLSFASAAVILGLAARPAELRWSMLAAGSLLTGIGFTMALFIADLAFDAGLINSAKLGILAASAVAATSGVLALIWLTTPVRS